MISLKTIKRVVILVVGGTVLLLGDPAVAGVPDRVGSGIFCTRKVADSLGHSNAHYSLEVASFAHFPILIAAHLTPLVAAQVMRFHSEVQYACWAC